MRVITKTEHSVDSGGNPIAHQTTTTTCDKCRTTQESQYLLFLGGSKKIWNSSESEWFYWSQAWGYNSERDGEVTELDLCPDCFENLLGDFIQEVS